MMLLPLLLDGEKGIGAPAPPAQKDMRAAGAMQNGPARCRRVGFSVTF
jgi:hypothetical protein